MNLEKSLTKHRSYERKLRNASSVNHLFRQVKRDQPEQVDVLIQDAQAVVSHVCMDDYAVEFASPVLWRPDEQFFHDGTALQTCHVEPDKIWLESISNINPGDTIVQPHRIGNLDALFDAFRDQWNARLGINMVLSTLTGGKALWILLERSSLLLNIHRFT